MKNSSLISALLLILMAFSLAPSQALADCGVCAASLAAKVESEAHEHGEEHADHAEHDHSMGEAVEHGDSE